MLTSIRTERSGPLTPSASNSNESGTGKATGDFSTLMSSVSKRLQQGISSRRQTGVTLPGKTVIATAVPKTPGPGDVVISPFNVLGLPISGTLAPTAAEVAANPAKYAGTSFDPARQLT